MFYEAINLNLNIAGAVKNPSKISTKKIKQVLLLIILCVYVRTYIYIYIYIYIIPRQLGPQLEKRK
jgi:L-asparagine transporter-like permease